MDHLFFFGLQRYCFFQKKSPSPPNFVLAFLVEKLWPEEAMLLAKRMRYSKSKQR